LPYNALLITNPYFEAYILAFIYANDFIFYFIKAKSANFDLRIAD